MQLNAYKRIIKANAFKFPFIFFRGRLRAWLRKSALNIFLMIKEKIMFQSFLRIKFKKLF
jgi:hypothetical protein